MSNKNNEQVVVEVILTPAEKMTLAIALAREERKKAKDEAKINLISNKDYVGYLASMEDEEEDIKVLDGLMQTANQMKPIIADDGTKYKVHCYSTAEYIFGPVAGRLLGLIIGSSAMFTEERQSEFTALTGVPYLAYTRAREAMGSPAYYNKGNYTEALEGNGESVNTAITAILQLLNLDLGYADKINTKTLTKWFTTSKVKAMGKHEESVKALKIDSTESFLLED